MNLPAEKTPMPRPDIDRYARGIGLLSRATAGLTPEAFQQHPGPGDWSIAQVVLHLVDSDLVGSDRMKRVIAEDNPPLLAYDENKWAAGLFYQDQPVDIAIALFDLNRRQMLEVLRRLDDSAFNRSGLHSERGRETLAELVQIYIQHLDHHLKFIYEKRQRLGCPVAAKYSDS
jgi:hypothetical protein